MTIPIRLRRYAKMAQTVPEGMRGVFAGSLASCCASSRMPGAFGVPCPGKRYGSGGTWGGRRPVSRAVKRLLTIGHSLVVALNGRLAHEIARAGQGRWSVTSAAPIEYPGDLRRIVLERFEGEASALVPLGTRAVGVPHLMLYRGLRPLLGQRWDLVHCWEEPYVAAAAQIARRTPANARFVFATFQNIPKEYPFPLAAFERRVLHRADGWIAFGKSTYEAQLGRDPHYASLPSRIISPGVDTSAFAPSANVRRAARESLGWTDDIPVVAPRALRAGEGRCDGVGRALPHSPPVASAVCR